MSRLLFPLPLLAVLGGACAPGGDEDLGEDTDVDVAVLRDCAAQPGTICPFAGTSRNGFNGDGLDRLDTWFSLPMSITFSPYGKPVVADWNNHKLRMLEDDGTFRTIMGTNFIGDGDVEQYDLAEGALGTDVNLNHPTQQRYFTSGVLLSASWHTHKLRIWDPLIGLTNVYLGGAYGFTPEESEPGIVQSAVGAQLNQPRWVEIDSEGNIFIVDMRNERIRKLDVANFTIQTVVGSGKKGIAGKVSGDPPVDCTSEDALETCLALPNNLNPEPGGAIQFSADENQMFIADSEAHTIRVFDRTTNQVTVLAGEPGVEGDADGTGREARFRLPAGLAFDAGTNTLFVADTNNHKVKAINVATGEVTTIAGTGEPTCPEGAGSLAVIMCADQALSGDGGPAEQARLYRPFGVDLDLDGHLVIADSYNHRFRILYR